MYERINKQERKDYKKMIGSDGEKKEVEPENLNLEGFVSWMVGMDIPEDERPTCSRNQGIISYDKYQAA